MSFVVLLLDEFSVFGGVLETVFLAKYECIIISFEFVWELYFFIVDYDVGMDVLLVLVFDVDHFPCELNDDNWQLIWN